MPFDFHSFIFLAAWQLSVFLLVQGGSELIKARPSSPWRQPLIKNLRPFSETSEKSADLKCPQIFKFILILIHIHISKWHILSQKVWIWTRIWTRIENLRPLLAYNYPPIISQKWSQILNQRLSSWWTSIPWKSVKISEMADSDWFSKVLKHTPTRF